MFRQTKITQFIFYEITLKKFNNIGTTLNFYLILCGLINL